MSDTITKQRGDTIRLRFTIWQGKRDESPRRDITGATLSNAAPSVTYPPPTITMTDGLNGEVEVVWTDEQTATMAPGRVHEFRLALDYPNGEGDVIPGVWLELQ